MPRLTPGRVEITEADLLDALREARQTQGQQTDHGPADALTVPEIAQAMGLAKDAARRILAPFVLAGAVECVRVRRPAMDGRLANVPAYRVVKPAKAAKAVKPKRPAKARGGR